MMEVYQMVIITNGPFQWRRGQVILPLPKKEDGKYNVQLIDKIEPISIAREDLIPL